MLCVLVSRNTPPLFFFLFSQLGTNKAVSPLLTLENKILRTTYISVAHWNAILGWSRADWFHLLAETATLTTPSLSVRILAATILTLNYLRIQKACSSNTCSFGAEDQFLM